MPTPTAGHPAPNPSRTATTPPIRNVIPKTLVFGASRSIDDGRLTSPPARAVEGHGLQEDGDEQGRQQRHADPFAGKNGSNAEGSDGDERQGRQDPRITVPNIRRPRTKRSERIGGIVTARPED
jgi:hypothetical protein